MISSEIATDLRCQTPGWVKFDESTRAPAGSGLYVIRVATGKQIPRVNGTSDIIYIGQGKFRKRVDEHRSPRHKGLLLRPIEHTVGGLEIAFFSCADQEQTETSLLFRYLKEHRELPPCNSKLDKLSTSQRCELILKFARPDAAPHQVEVTAEFLTASGS